MTQHIETILLDANAALKAPDVTRLTTQSVEGTGVFDVMMKTTKLHLLEEYEAGRITGEEYATVYIGALGAVMQQSVAFLLNSQQEEKIMAEIALVRQKTVTELAQTDDDIPVGLGFNGDSAVEGIVKLQKDKLLLEGTLVDSQVTKAVLDGKYLGQKIVTELAQTCDNLDQASVAGHGYNDSADVQGLAEAQIGKTAAERVLLDQKVVTEVSQTSDTKPTDLGIVTGTTAITGLVESQKKKVDSEVVLLSQKSITELAQTSDIVPNDTPALNTLVSVTGVIDKQKKLFAKQTDGYDRDAEQKLAKMLLDTWSVSATLDTATANSTNKLDDSSLGAVVTKAKTGIGV